MSDGIMLMELDPDLRLPLVSTVLEGNYAPDTETLRGLDALLEVLRESRRNHAGQDPMIAEFEDELKERQEALKVAALGHTALAAKLVETMEAEEEAMEALLRATPDEEAKAAQEAAQAEKAANLAAAAVVASKALCEELRSKIAGLKGWLDRAYKPHLGFAVPSLPCFEEPKGWTPVLTSGARQPCDTADQATREAASQAHKEWEANRTAANLRKLNDLRAKVARGSTGVESSTTGVESSTERLVGRAIPQSTQIEPVYARLRANITSLDSSLGRLMAAFALRNDDKKVVNRVARMLDILVAKLPSELRDQVIWSVQKGAAYQAFKALKTGALDTTQRSWTERALVQNSRVFAAGCAVRMEGEAFAPAQATGVNPEKLEFTPERMDKLARKLEGRKSSLEAAAQEEAAAWKAAGVEPPEQKEEAEDDTSVQELGFNSDTPFAHVANEEDSSDTMTEDEELKHLHYEVVEFGTVQEDRQIDAGLAFASHWEALPEMFQAIKTVSAEKEMADAVLLINSVLDAVMISAVRK